jgi:hypothetical protein
LHCATAVRNPTHGINTPPFVGLSGGSADIITLAVAYRLRDKVIVDAVRENKRTSLRFRQ